MIYQILGAIIGIIAILIAIIRFREGKTSVGMFLFWLLVWITIIVVSINPDATSILANMFGIGRGLDLILILGLIGCYYLIFKIYTMIEQVESEITSLVRQIALNNEKMEKNLKEEEKE